MATKWTAIDWTDRTMEQIIAHIKGIYARAQKEVGKTWKAYMEEQDAKVAALGKAYGEAKKSGDKDAIRAAGIAVSKAKQERTIMNRHYQQLTYNLAQNISHVNETAVAYVNGKLPAIYSMNYNEVAQNASADAGRLGVDIGFDLVDQSTIRRLAAENESLLPYRKIDGKRDVRWNVEKINAEVTQGILQGESIPHIATRLSDVLHMNEVSAIRNARTAVTSAQNKGRIDMMHDADDKGVIMQKGWSCCHDGRERKWHADLDDGEYIDIDEPFENEYGEIMYPGDPDADDANVYNCRCALIYDVVGFRRR